MPPVSHRRERFWRVNASKGAYTGHMKPGDQIVFDVIEAHENMEAQNGGQYAILSPPQLQIILPLATQHTQRDQGGSASRKG